MVIKLGDTVHILGFTHKSGIFLGGGRIERHRTGEISRVKQITKIYKFNPPSNTIVYLLENGKEYDLKIETINKVYDAIHLLTPTMYMFETVYPRTSNQQHICMHDLANLDWREAMRSLHIILIKDMICDKRIPAEISEQYRELLKNIVKKIE